MKLSLVTETFLPEINGVAMTLGRLTKELSDGGWEVSVIAPSCKNRLSHCEKMNVDLLEVWGMPIPFYTTGHNNM